MSWVRKDIGTPFLSHSLTRQPPSPSGSATRNSPSSRPSITRSTVGRVEPSTSSAVSIVRRLHRLGAALAVDTGELEHIFGALAERGDARVMHAQPLHAQGLRDIGQQ